jgi:hypothetical protein
VRAAIREAHSPARRVGCGVLHAGEGVQPSMSSGPARDLDDGQRRRGGQALALVLRQDRPAVSYTVSPCQSLSHRPMVPTTAPCSRLTTARMSVSPAAFALLISGDTA